MDNNNNATFTAEVFDIIDTATKEITHVGEMPTSD